MFSYASSILSAQVRAPVKYVCHLCFLPLVGRTSTMVLFFPLPSYDSVHHWPSGKAIKTILSNSELVCGGRHTGIFILLGGSQQWPQGRTHSDFPIFPGGAPVLSPQQGEGQVCRYLPVQLGEQSFRSPWRLGSCIHVTSTTVLC